jgi:putative DNA primase/helicase
MEPQTPLSYGTAPNNAVRKDTIDALKAAVNAPKDKLSEIAAVEHAEILEQLLESLQPIDFQLEAFPEVEKLRQQAQNGSDTEKQQAESLLGRLKPAQKHYLIITVEKVLETAKRKRWNLAQKDAFFYVYNGAFWAQFEPKHIQYFLGQAALRLGVERFTALLYEFQNKLIRQMETTAHLPKLKPDVNKVLINLQNGTLEITADGRIQKRGFNPADFLTYQLPFVYEPTATAPIFQAYLDRVLPDKSKQAVLSEFIGSCFLRNGCGLKMEKALILYGSGANGKSVFFEVISALFGKHNISHYTFESLTDEKGYQRAQIADKLINYASEISSKVNPAMAKALISGEGVEARLPYGEPFIMEHYAKLIFNCNELPRETEHSEAYFRRFIILHFDVTIPTAERDKTLHKRIIESELTGVFVWVLNGLKRLLAQKDFTYCEAAEKTLQKYREDSNSVLLFLNDNGYEKSSSSILLKDLYDAYKSFCIEDGYKPVNKKNFKERLGNSGVVITQDRYGNQVYLAKN